MDNKDSDHVTVERDGHLTIMTINRPAAANAINAPMQAQMAAMFDDFEADPDQWVAIVTGAGDRIFSAGHDIKQSAAGVDAAIPASGFGGLTARFGRTKPVIAAVNGAALGGGFELALACDIIVAAENASFALTEARVGFVALAGGIPRLIQTIGSKRAVAMLLTGRRIAAAEGAAMGLVAEIVPQGQALSAARRWAEEVMQSSPMAVRGTLEVAQLTSSALAGIMALSWTGSAVRANIASQDKKEGARAFAEGRKPQWTGK